MDQAGKLILIIGPSGVGKSIIIKKLKLKHPALHFPKSATTRIKRKGEGNDLYHFVSENEFDDLSKNGKLLEWAVVHGGARYGTLSEEIFPYIDKGKIVIREVDVQGYDSIRASQHFRGENPEYKMESIFILPDNKNQLIKRIKERAPISEQELNRRIASMEQELSYADECDYKIVNKESRLDETIAEVERVLN